MYLTMKVRWWYWWILMISKNPMRKTRQHENLKQDLFATSNPPWLSVAEAEVLEIWAIHGSWVAPCTSPKLFVRRSSHRLPTPDPCEKKNNEMAGHQGGWGMVRSLYHGVWWLVLQCCLSDLYWFDLICIDFRWFWSRPLLQKLSVMVFSPGACWKKHRRMFRNSQTLLGGCTWGFKWV